MSATTEAAFYDRTMTADDAPAMIPVEASPWLPLYVEAAGWIPRNHPVTDLGCGTGKFLELLLGRDHEGALTGIDFSGAALSEAALALPVPQPGQAIQFVREDLREWRPSRRRSGNTSYVCLEVLEHLEDDRELARRIPPGHQFVFSVPNYESEAHLRVFRSVGDVFARYDRWLAFRRWSLIELGGGKAIHVLDTSRRNDSW